MSVTIRVLVVDDSLFVQKRITEMLNDSSDIHVVGQAKDGAQAIDLARELEPDVITMDIEMPRMDGLEAIERIMAADPRPIVVVSSHAKKDGKVAVEAMNLGVVDIVEKPGGSVSLDLERVRVDLIEKVRTASRVRVVRNTRGPRGAAPQASPVEEKVPSRLPREDDSELEPSTKEVVCIGSSTGGPGILGKILSALPEDYPLPIVIAQHMPSNFTKSFAAQLNRRCALEVKEIDDGEHMSAATVYIAPGGAHAKVTRSGCLELCDERSVDGPVPSADLLFESAAASFGSGVAVIVLSGMGSDGAVGVQRVHEVGGQTVVQHEETCAVFGMPKAAIETGCVRKVLSIEGIVMELRRTAVYSSGRGDS